MRYNECTYTHRPASARIDMIKVSSACVMYAVMMDPRLGG